MAGTRTSSRAGTRSSPRSSPVSARSTPSRKPAAGSTPLKQSVTPNRGKGSTKISKGKTSPYFNSKTNSHRTSRRVKDDSDEDEEEQDHIDVASESEDEESENSKADATGLTSSSSSSSSDSGQSEDEFALSEDEEGEEGEDDEDDVEEDEESEMDSDFLDEEEDKKKRSGRKSTSKSAKATPNVKRKSNGSGTNGSAVKRVKTEGSGSKTHEPIPGYETEDEYDEDDEIELEEGQEIAGRIYPAPKTGQVPPGRISQNTLNFLKNMQIPERNDREWFRSHEPAFRQAEKEWKMFVGIVQTKFHESDPEVPVLPPKDVIHRIYRDVRFSSDKTPYKKSFSLSTSRGGRKGIWAAYHLSISPNNRSILACGVWQPGKNELASIRHSFQTDPQSFRDIISDPEFVRLFGPPTPHKKGERQNVFGNEDALKVAPKGMDKEHKDIDLLKLRSVAVVHHFTDEEVLAKDFQEQIANVVSVMAPFVHRLNDMITLPVDTADNDD